MPSWKKVIVSGSDASLNSLYSPSITGSFTGSFFGDGSGLTNVAAAIAIKDEGTQLTPAVASIDFVGAGVTATTVGSNVTVTINGGGSSVDTGSFATTGSNIFKGNQTITGSLIIASASSGDLVRITQTGTGNAFVVEDSSNPDTTPFVISNDGRVSISTNPSVSPITSKFSSNAYNDGYATAILAYGFNPLGASEPAIQTAIIAQAETGNNIAIGIDARAYGGGGDYSPIMSIAGKFSTNALSAENYAVQLIDGTEGLNKVLISKTTDGKANWSNTINITSVTASFTGSLKGSLTGTASFASTASYYPETDPVFVSVSGSFTTTSSFNSFTSSYTTGSFTGSFIGDGSGLIGVISSSYSSNAQLLDGSDKAVFATTGSNVFKASQIITGSLTITNDLVVLGSSSIQYITSSQLNIADNIITVNTYNPSIRFGGLAVIDSGSSPQTSGSLLFDSQNNQWIFVHQDGGSATTSSVLIMGPQTFNNIGNETTITTNRLTKGTGGDLGEHIGDSNITDTGAVVSINSNTEVTGSVTITNSLTVGGTIIGNGGMSMSGSNSVTGSLIITGSTSTNLVRITQTGAGNALVVEDSSNPDSSVFVIDASGRVGIGTTAGSIYGHLSVDTTVIGGISAIYGTSNTIGVYAYAPTAVKGESTILGLHGKTENDTVATGTGVWGQATYTGEGTPPLINIGGKFQADTATSNYSVQLIDGTETVAGRFLINQTTDGKANWGNSIPTIQVTSAITGSTNNNTSTDALIQASLLYLSNNC